MYRNIIEKPKILFVDDEPANIDVFRMNFAERFEIHGATSGAEALSIFERHENIGIVVTDHRMPGMTGVELCAALYRMNPDTVRIIVTAYTEFQNILDAINHGHIYHYVLKPWDPAQLGIVLEQGMHKWRLIAENKKLMETQAKMNSKLHTLSKTLVNAQEGERKRIAMELHDDIGQNLVALKLQLGNVTSLAASGGDDELLASLAIMKQTLKDTIDNTRNLSQNLSPAMLEEFGFDRALEEFFESFSRDYRIAVEADMVHLENCFCDSHLHQLYRVFQEIFNNIGKHSGTDRVIVQAKITHGSLQCEIADFGSGFVEEQIARERKRKRGLGFSTIKERVTVLGGEIRIVSKLDGGTRYLLTLPRQR